MSQELRNEVRRQLRGLASTLHQAYDRLDAIAGRADDDLFVPPAGINADIAHNFGKRHSVNPSVPVMDTESLHTIDREVS